MTTFPIEEVEAEFRRYWQVGMILEDWNAWCDLFVDDVQYDERIYGTMHGRETVRAWIVPLMEKYRDIYGVYDWHHSDPSGRVVFRMENRRDRPGGGAPIDFPGISIIHYAGGGRWRRQEDYWAEKLGTATFVEYEKALKKHDPRHRERATRLDWGSGPDWTKGPASFWDHPGRAKPEGL